MILLCFVVRCSCDCLTIANQNLKSYSHSKAKCVKIDKCLFAEINLLSQSINSHRTQILSNEDENSIVFLSNIEDIEIMTTTFVKISSSSGIITIRSSEESEFHQICASSITSTTSAFIDIDSDNSKASMTYSTYTLSNNNFLNLKILDFESKGLNLTQISNGGIVANCNSHFNVKISAFENNFINSQKSDTPDTYGGQRLALIYSISDHAKFELMNVCNNTAKGERGNDNLFLLDDFLESTFDKCYFLQNQFKYIFDVKKDSDNRHETNYILTIEYCSFSESKDFIMKNLREAGIKSNRPPLFKKNSDDKLIKDESIQNFLNENNFEQDTSKTYTLSFLNTVECQAKFTYSDKYHPTKKPLMAGHIIAIVFVCLAVLALLIELIVFLTIGKKKREKMGDESQIQLVAENEEDDKSMIRMSILE